MLVLINRGEHWQCGYVIAKGSADRLKALGIEKFRENIEALAPFMAGRTSELKSFGDVKLLIVAAGRLPLWHRPGLLCIGYAAHAMSPVGGAGKIKPPWIVRLFIHFPLPRRLPAGLINIRVPPRSLRRLRRHIPRRGSRLTGSGSPLVCLAKTFRP